jgi:predicted DNA-binding transcriptional regulator AlpA
MAKIILRLKQVLNRLACGKTKFDDDYRHHSDDDPYVTGAPGVKRLKPIPLGERNIGFLEHEVDELIDALAEAGGHTESKGTRTTRVFLTDALPPKLTQERSEVLERRNRLRAQVIADADPELRTQLEEIDRELRALDPMPRKT